MFVNVGKLNITKENTFAWSHNNTLLEADELQKRRQNETHLRHLILIIRKGGTVSQTSPYALHRRNICFQGRFTQWNLCMNNSVSRSYGEVQGGKSYPTGRGCIPIQSFHLVSLTLRAQPVVNCGRPIFA